MSGVLTDDELRRILLERGPAWIRAQATAYGAMGRAVPEQTAALFRRFFGSDVDRARVAIARIEDPPFYSELRTRGVDERELLPFAANMGGITFDGTIILGSQLVAAEASAQLPGLLFHELVHVVQYRLLGVDRFAQRYVDGWLAGRVLRDEPMRRYETIPLEAMAFQLQRRFAKSPAAVFSVEDAARVQLGLSRRVRTNATDRYRSRRALMSFDRSKYGPALVRQRRRRRTVPGCGWCACPRLGDRRR
jgi:hypothetical protein